MNNQIKTQIEEMKKQTIGVEIEMANITREKAIKVIAKFFGTAETVSHDGGSYDTWSCTDNEGRRWTITRDVSIRARNDYEKAELATPILTYADIEPLQEIARLLRKAGLFPTLNTAVGCMFTSVRTDTTQRPFATWQTLWQATRHCLAKA